MYKLTLSEDITNTASFGEEKIPAVMLRFMLQRAAQEIIPQERVRVCLKYHAPNKQTVQLRRIKEAKKAYFSGLMICGSVWHCPVCAAKISEERRIELQRTMIDWTGGAFMVTYTLSHSAGEPLKNVLNALIASGRKFKSGDAFQEIKDMYGWVGSVKSLEVTVGDNGWHPHIHELVFTTNKLEIEALDTLENTLKKRWVKVVHSEGYSANYNNGLTLKDDNKWLRDYVSKWGHEPTMTTKDYKKRWTLAHEITKQVVKKARGEHRTPMQLLLDYTVDDFQAGELWREYALAFKGKKQLTWSNGMREILGFGKELKDEELAEREDENFTVYAIFNLSQWRQILRSDMRGEILHKASYMSQDDFALWFASLELDE